MKNNQGIKLLGTITLAGMAGVLTPALGQSTVVNQKAIAKQRAATAALNADNPNAQRIRDVEPIRELLGRPVLGPNNGRLGTLENIVLDLESGRVLYGAIKLAQGKTVAVPPGAFAATPGNALRLKVSQEKLAGAPVFNPADLQTANLGTANFLHQVYQHFGLSAWWQGSGQAANQGSFNNVHLAKSLTGMRVQNVADQPIGHIRTALLDMPAGRVVYLILDPVNNQQLGNNLFVLPPQAFTKSSKNNMLTSDVTKEKLSGAPKFPRSNNRPNLATRDYLTRVYQYYGKDPYLLNSDAALHPTGGEIQSVFPQQRQPARSGSNGNPNAADQADSGGSELWENGDFEDGESDANDQTQQERRWLRQRNQGVDPADRNWDRQQDRNSDPYDRDGPPRQRNRLQDRNQDF